MPVYEYRCHTCGHVFDEVSSFSSRKTETPCPLCQGKAFYQFSVGGVDNASEAPAWLKDTIQVVDPEGGPVHTEFIRNPTRENYHRWLNATGLRHKESGEPTRPAQYDTSKLRKEMVEAHIKRHRIEI